VKWLDDIPRIWKQAYLLICTWHAINFAISGVVEWKFINPKSYVLWNTLFLFEALCICILLIFLWTYWLSRFQAFIQIAGHVAGIVIFYFAMGTLSYYFNDYIEGLVYFEHWQEHMIELLSWDAIRFHDQYIITVGVFYIISYFQGLQKKDQEKSELALKNKEMQISLLKSQINPHFLFNTLNSISTLVHSSKEKARKVITQLSDIFRYALDSHNGEMVKLQQEIEFIENYILIQQVRFGDRLIFIKEIDATCLSMRIPPMILQPLVENSVKYGIAPKKEGGTIHLSVRRAGGIVFFEVRDNGLGINAKKVMDSSGSGVGMANTDLRLKSYFGPQSGLRVRATDRGYSVSFYIEDKKLQQDGVGETKKEIVEEQIHLN
jgi:two-component system LytT family sensor kinase